MELFAREHQHESLPMLRDVIKLYMMNDMATLDEAVTAIKDYMSLLQAERDHRMTAKWEVQ